MIAAGTAFSFVSSLKVMSKSCDLKILINKIVLINTANAERQPKWVIINCRSQPQVALTIKTGGAA